MGRFTRAAVFAGAAALAGCGGKGKPAEQTNTIENEAEVTVDAGVPDAGPAQVKVPDDTCCMPYGAPPMRERVV